MPVYGGDLKKFSAKVASLVYTEEVARDWTIEAATFLALAFYATERLKDIGVPLEFQGRKLVVSSLEQAWRELLHLRLHLPADLMKDIERAVSLTRTGQIINKENPSAREYRSLDALNEGQKGQRRPVKMRVKPRTTTKKFVQRRR